MIIILMNHTYRMKDLLNEYMYLEKLFVII